MTFKPPYYYSYDDGLNEPYIAGPYTLDELRKSLPDDLSVSELTSKGVASDGFGESYELWTPEKLRKKIAEELEQIRRMEAGEKLP